MAAYCVPILIAKGGHKEILGDELNNYLWKSNQECINKTLSLIKNERERATVAEAMRHRAESFTPERFNRLLFKMIDV